jgi:RNA polymerase sigma-70 factor (ECF subfamily)
MSLLEGDERAHNTADAVARRSYGKLVAFLAARTGDVAAAEDALSEAFTAALRDWPLHGCPANPEGWLLTVARRRTIDRHRGQRLEEPASDRLQVMADQTQDAHEIPDRRLGLMFACAHPAIDETIRAPLILQAVLGLDARTIASAFLTSPAAMSKRLVRAKEKIRQAGIPLRIPNRDELPQRLAAVLDAIYATFSEGWTDPQGTDATRRDFTQEALFLGHLTAELLPREPEPLGLLALMLHAESRRRARRTARGEYVPLARQDPALWEAPMIAEAEALLHRAQALGAIGRYQLEAALQSAHVDRCRTGRPNWPEVLQLYDALLALAGSPVIAINRALAVAETQGPEAGLEALGAVAHDERVKDYQPWWAARAELLSRAGARAEAREAWQRAIGLERDPAVRQFLQNTLEAWR